jgi:hypothetical protein
MIIGIALRFHESVVIQLPSMYMILVVWTREENPQSRKEKWPVHFDASLPCEFCLLFLSTYHPAKILRSVLHRMAINTRVDVNLSLIVR